MNWEVIIQKIEASAPRLLGALAIFIVGQILIRFVIKWVERGLRSRKTDETRMRFFLTFIRFSLMVVLVLSVLEQIGSFTTTVTTIVGAVTLSIGLATQGALSNLAGGIIIVAGRPFILGDYVETPQFEGEVTNIGILTTTFTTADNQKIVIPNGKLSSDFIINHTAYDLRRVDVPVRFETVVDLEAAKKALLELAQSDSRVLSTPAPTVTASESSDYRSILTLKAWVETEHLWQAQWSLVEGTRKILIDQQVGGAIPTMNVILNDPRNS